MFRLVLVSALLALVYGKAALVYPPLPNLDGRIVGGAAVTIEQFPYQVSLEMYGRHLCGGSLIRPNVVLTAAHCTAGSFASEFVIRVGSAEYGRGGQVADVFTICDHPKYTPQYDYDVSVLHLDRSFTLGPTVQLVPLQPVGKEIADGTAAVVSGWGALSSGGPRSKILQAVQVPKVSQGSCEQSYIRYNITDRMTCYGYKEGGKDACQGDSGGPLVVDGKQVGIVSWAIGCASSSYPGIYTKLSHAEVNKHINTCIANFKD